MEDGDGMQSPIREDSNCCWGDCKWYMLAGVNDLFVCFRGKSGLQIRSFLMSGLKDLAGLEWALIF